jgi:hypothetical protein
MTPRIYTYKITFEEIPHWYWGVHKEKNYGEEYLGSPVTHSWMWEFYTPRVQLLEFFESLGEASEVEKRLISLDINNPLCLNENVGGMLSSESRARGGRIGGKIGGKVSGGNHRDNKTGFCGRSAEKMTEDGKKGGKIGGPKGGRKTKELGLGLHAPGKAAEGGKTTSSQVWESTIDGFIGHPGNVAKHNKANGWDPNARRRIG